MPAERLEKCPRSVQATKIEFERESYKCFVINWLPRMDSNHDKVIQRHLSLASVASQEFRGGKPGKQKLSKISFDSFRAKFRPNR